MRQVALIVALLVAVPASAYTVMRRGGIGIATDFTQDANCIAHWDFVTDGGDNCTGDEADTLTALNGATFNNTADLPSNTDSTLVRALELDGTDDVACEQTTSGCDTNDDDFEPANGDKSWLCWFKGDAETDGIIMGVTGGGAQNNEMAVQLDSTDFSYWVDDGSINEGTSDSSWHHYAVVWQNGGSPELEVYRDGASVGTSAVGTVVGTADNFAIGDEYNGGRAADGRAADCAVMGRVLTATEVCMICKCGFQGNSVSAERTCGSCSMGSVECG